MKRIYSVNSTNKTMEPQQKRKRTTVAAVKIESVESDDEVECSDSDTDYEPIRKKPKPPPKEKKEKTAPVRKPKAAKVPKEKKPKAVKKTTTGGTRGRKKKTPGNVQDGITVNDSNPILKNEGIPSAVVLDDNSLPPLSESDNAVKNEEMEISVLNAVAEAKSFCEPWRDEEAVSESCHVPVDVARNVITLLNQDCTIPFIVRYRREMTGGLQAEKLREIQSASDEVKQVHKKVDTILKTIKHEKFDANMAASFLCAKSLEEVELLYAPFKPGSKKTLAERSKQLGLEPFALELLEVKTTLRNININSLIKPQKGLQSEQEILSGIQHIVADKVSKDRRVLDFIRQKIHHPQIRILSTKSATAEKVDKQAFVEGKSTQNFKYENYYKLNVTVANVASHQVMAINRGEKQKVLKVKIQIPLFVKNDILRFIWDTFFYRKSVEHDTETFMRTCIEDSYDRLIEPYMSRQIRSELSKKAEKESINVFGSNVRSLLLTPPVRGKTILGIDPGFSHGCKIATVSSKGEVLGTDVIYPHSRGKKNGIKDSNADKVRCMISNHGVEIIAIGNGTACRETEVWLSDLINSRYFHPFQVKYCIVNENGASIYSVTKEAEAELPNMDPNIRSAVSISRRLQDPLLEYVKIEPKHLGVGMYQHDVSESQLKKTLDSIVEECVSFVGVDLNVCSELLLRKISGLSATRAKQIIEWRNKNTSFINRQQLLEIKGLGQKSFEQCAGFVKILPETCASIKSALSKDKKKAKFFTPNPLDKTIIHPESYEIAQKFLIELKAESQEIGQQSLVEKVKKYMFLKCAEDVAKTFSVSVSVMQLIIDAFQQLQDYDMRKEFDTPLFHTSVRTFADLRVGQELSGRVSNVTAFGAFVDVGVGQDGLIHISKMKGKKLSVGDRVTIRVLEKNVERKRLSLELIL